MPQSPPASKPLTKSEQTNPSTPWWRGAVIYQIYPRSFNDTSETGIGDLNGIKEKIPYVADLGVDGIWLSPFFTSPMKDFGYDIADYCNVDPMFGSLSDFDQLIETAHKHGLKVIIDQVYSHTSDQHAWFAESRQDKTNPKADWYVWADPKVDGSPPNNWQSVFGMSSWEWDGRRQQYYLHNFLASQPDLNLHNQAVQESILSVAKFWLDRGIDGFRLDAINFAMHDPRLRDNPPAPADRSWKSRPYDYQLHQYNQSHANIPAFLERLRALTDQYSDIFTVAEIGGSAPLDDINDFIGGNKRLTTAYNFAFLYQSSINDQIVHNALSEWGGGDHEWPSWAFSNHDAPRVASRWTSEVPIPNAAKLFGLLLISLRGNIFLYQGEELGLTQSDIPFEALQDPEAIANWPHTLGRDGARTPMPWEKDGLHAGFSNAPPWLPVSEIHASAAVDAQQSDPASVLNFFRKLIKFRKNKPALRGGNLSFQKAPDRLLVFERREGKNIAQCVFNFTNKPIPWSTTMISENSETLSVVSGEQDQEGVVAPFSGTITVWDAD